MTMWWLVLAAYLALGLITTWMAAIGHKLKYGYPIGWAAWIAGPIAWPVMFIVGMWRK